MEGKEHNATRPRPIQSTATRILGSRCLGCAVGISLNPLLEEVELGFISVSNSMPKTGEPMPRHFFFFWLSLHFLGAPSPHPKTPAHNTRAVEGPRVVRSRLPALWLTGFLWTLSSWTLTTARDDKRQGTLI